MEEGERKGGINIHLLSYSTGEIQIWGHVVGCGAVGALPQHVATPSLPRRQGAC